MKKLISFSILALFCVSFVSAYYGGYYDDPISGFGRGVEQVIELVERTAGPLFAVIFGGDWNFLFEKVIFFAIILSIVYVVCTRIEIIKDNKVVVWIISISVSVLSTRFLVETDLVMNMILPYTVLGVAITALLPLVIYFIFVQSFDSSSTLRKVLWIFFIVAFFGIWASRYESVGSLSWIYFFTAVLALIFLLADGTIRRAILKQQFGASDFDSRVKRAADLADDLEKLDNQYAQGTIPKPSYDRMKKRILKQIESLRKH